MKQVSCPEDSEALAGAPLGQYHCPYCLAMCVAGWPHPTDDEVREQGGTPFYEAALMDAFLETHGAHTDKVFNQKMSGDWHA